MQLKISSLILGIFLSFSSLTFAGGMIIEESPGKVTVPCQRSSWQLGIYGMYLHPGYSDQLSYINSNSIVSNGGTTASTTNIHVNENWDWAGMVEGGYHFNCGNDVTVNWLYHQNKDNQSYLSSSLDIDPGTLLYINFPYRSSSRAELTFDRINIEMGQHVDFGEIKDIRFHAGFQYVKFDFSNSASGTGVTDSRFTETRNKSATFSGFGPRVGMDLAYYLMDGFSIFGKSSVAALVGTTESKNSFAFTDPSNLVPNLTTTYHDKRDNQIVPVVALDIGMKYTVAAYQNVYMLDAGYMWSGYIAIAHNLNINNGGEPSGGGRPSDANFYLQGPYVGIKWLGQV